MSATKQMKEGNMTIEVTTPNLFAPYRVHYNRDKFKLTVDFHCAEIAQNFAREHNGRITELFSGTELPLTNPLWCEPCGITHV